MLMGHSRTESDVMHSHTPKVTSQDDGHTPKLRAVATPQNNCQKKGLFLKKRNGGKKGIFVMGIKDKNAIF